MWNFSQPEVTFNNPAYFWNGEAPDGLQVGTPNLFEILVNNAAVTKLCARRIYQDRAPQRVPADWPATPYAVYLCASTQQGQTFCEQDDLTLGSYQVDVYATDALTKEYLARAIQRAVVGFTGPSSADPTLGARICSAQLQTKFDQAPDLDPGLYRKTMLFSIWYWEI